NGDYSGEIRSGGDLGNVQINGALGGSAGNYSGEVLSLFHTASVSVGDLVQGGSGKHSGQIYSVWDLGPVSIGGDLVGGVGDHSGYVASKNGKITGVTIGGSLNGDVYIGTNSALIEAGQDLGPVTIDGDIDGGVVHDTGEIIGHGNVGLVKVGGSVKA